MNYIVQSWKRRRFSCSGGGDVGRHLLRKLSPVFRSRINGVLVSQSGQSGNKVEGIEIFAANQCDLSQATVLISTMPESWPDIYEALSTMKCSHILVPGEQIYDDIRFLGQSRENALVPHTRLRFEVQLAEHCNLNCKGCTHFAPLAEPGFLNKQQYEKDCERLSELFGGDAEWIHLMGGEPLLNPDIVDIIQITRNAFPHGTIQLVTNGVLLGQMKEIFWITCRECAIEVCPTRYPIQVDYRKAEALAGKYNVHFRYYNEGQVIKTLDRVPLTRKGNQNPYNNYRHCLLANDCCTLRNGKMFNCVFPAHIHHLNKYFKEDFYLTPQDYVDIYSVQTGQELMEKLASPNAFCRFCDIYRIEWGFPFSQSEKMESEWVNF